MGTLLVAQGFSVTASENLADTARELSVPARAESRFYGLGRAVVADRPAS
jgi:hypothetical protein